MMPIFLLFSFFVVVGLLLLFMKALRIWNELVNQSSAVGTGGLFLCCTVVLTIMFVYRVLFPGKKT